MYIYIHIHVVYIWAIYIYIYGIYTSECGQLQCHQERTFGNGKHSFFLINGDVSGSKRLGQVLSRGRVGGYGDLKTRGCGGSDGLIFSQILMETYGRLYSGLQGKGYAIIVDIGGV